MNKGVIKIKSFKYIVVIIQIVIFVLMCGCNKNSSEDNTDYGVFSTNKSAQEYIEGYWTDSKMNYFYARSTSDNVLIDYTFSMPTVENAALYMIDGGKLFASYLDENNEAKKEPIMTLEYVDDNSFNIISLINGESYKLTRDSITPEEGRLDEEYVFKTLDHAVVYLNGYWTDKEDNYIAFTNTNGKAKWNTNLSMPEFESINFCDGKLVCLSSDEEGNEIITPALIFSITDENHMMIENLYDGYKAEFLKDSDANDNVDEYAFWNKTYTIKYLYGSWVSDDKAKFEIKADENGQISMSTTLSTGKYSGYDLGRGCMIGIDKDGNEETIMTFTSNGMNEMTISSNDKTYTMHRVVTDDEGNTSSS